MENGKFPAQSKTQLAAEIRAKKEKIKLLEKQYELRVGLPFLYGWKWYAWARDFYESHNKVNLLCAANQISKSSTQIRKCINWATDQALWPSLWLNKPRQFWYLYPTASQATIEFEQKWVQFLPTGKFKEDAQYGWKVVYKNKEVHAIYFNSGVTIYFKSYAQDAMALQTGTCDAIFCDEELPVDIYDELMFRLSASNGYFHMVFTATMGQEFWRKCMEPEGFEDEKLKGAWKRSVSMYECQHYDDGTPSHWTDDKIQMVKNRCKNDKEILKRVYGRFVRDDSGLKYEQFSIKRHMKPWHPVPKDWLVYAGVDVGSGGTQNHPGAICFVAVRPDFRAGRVFLAWRGDQQDTTADDIMNQFRKMRDEHKLTLTGQFYDWASKDFETIAGRLGEPFLKADKSHDRGEDIINVLFKNNMMMVYETDETQKLASELISLRKETPKNKAKDDLADAFRYAVTLIPWDFTVITPESAFFKPAEDEKPKNHMERQIEDRRKWAVEQENDDDGWNPEQEIAEANENYGYDG